jgi:hypothetical protein
MTASRFAKRSALSLLLWFRPQPPLLGRPWARHPLRITRPCEPSSWRLARLAVQALDARETSSPASRSVSWPSGRFQGSVDSSGFVRGGAPGTKADRRRGQTANGSPYAERIEVWISRPAARITPPRRRNCSSDSDCTSTPWWDRVR